MDRFFSLFGKIVLGLLLLGGLAYGGYSIGKGNLQLLPQPEGTPTDQPLEPSEHEEGLPTPTPTSVSSRLIQGGVDESVGLVFDRFSLEVPNDWTVDRETGPGSERLFIRKGEYELTIFQAATGGALCLYPGDPDFEGPSSRYDTFIDLTTQDGSLLRQSGNKLPSPSGKAGLTLCQQNPEGDFNQPTTYGHVAYAMPANYNQAVLAEMDRMVSSLKAL